MKKSVFISHRTKDQAIADMLLNFFARAGLPISDIFCSSRPENAVKLTVSRETRTALEASVVNIATLSREYYRSAYCLNEAGVFWMMEDVPVIPIALPDITENDLLGFLNSDYHLRRLDKQTDISFIYRTVRETLSIPTADEVLLTSDTGTKRSMRYTHCR